MSEEDRARGCILFRSYIKPQLGKGQARWREGCILFRSYIKPQRPVLIELCQHVLYLIPFLYQTTTHRRARAQAPGCILFRSYIKPQP